MSNNTAPEIAAVNHCLPQMPYRTIVYIRNDHNGVALYSVAGAAGLPRNAANALRLAFAAHGGVCFYCGKEPPDMTIDHAQPQVLGGRDYLSNLVIACAPCNRDKGRALIEAFHPQADRSWLKAAHQQIAARLAALE